MHSAVDVEKHTERGTSARECLREGLNNSKIIYHCAETSARKPAREGEQALNVWTNRLVAQEHILRSGTGCHFSLSDGCALELCYAQLDVHLHYFSELVSLDVRTKSLPIADYVNGSSDVPLDAISVNEQGGGRDFLDVRNLIPAVVHR